MQRIGLLSDTHGHLDAAVFSHFGDCDEVWHAGDIGNAAVSDALSAVKPFRAVHGNVDGPDLRAVFPEVLHWRCEDLSVLMLHIGGRPGRYPPAALRELRRFRPGLFVTGHSHILRIERDASLDCLHVNPGAAGLQGWHRVRTIVRFTVDGGRLRDLEVVELMPRRPSAGPDPTIPHR